jgi:hypothetical protein
MCLEGFYEQFKWHVLLHCGFLELLREIIRSFMSQREHLPWCGNSEEKMGFWESTHGCYGNNLLFYPILFYFFVQLLKVNDLVGIWLSSRIWEFFYELPHRIPIGFWKEIKEFWFLEVHSMFFLSVEVVGM